MILATSTTLPIVGVTPVAISVSVRGLAPLTAYHYLFYLGDQINRGCTPLGATDDSGALPAGLLEGLSTSVTYNTTGSSTISFRIFRASECTVGDTYPFASPVGDAWVQISVRLRGAPAHMLWPIEP